MTGDEMIVEARTNFGERTALTLTNAEFQAWVNTALREVYNLLPVPELEVLAQTATVTLTGGIGPLPAALDHLLSVHVDDVPCQLVINDDVGVIDANPFMTPYVPVATTDGEDLWVRHTFPVPSAQVTFIQPPAKITNFTSEIVLPKWHAAMVLFISGFAYAAEEDIGQAQHFRNTALALLGRGAEAHQEAIG